MCMHAHMHFQIPSRAIYAPDFLKHLIEPTIISNEIST